MQHSQQQTRSLNVVSYTGALQSVDVKSACGGRNGGGTQIRVLRTCMLDSHTDRLGSSMPVLLALLIGKTRPGRNVQTTKVCSGISVRRKQLEGDRHPKKNKTPTKGRALQKSTKRITLAQTRIVPGLSASPLPLCLPAFHLMSCLDGSV
mmetsp:Transcript_54827/g.107270  ORF Transcript_54827/g.107270 Transcript_54827/m.107270 type:complete len:150 (-) Transcript_54827:1742-2191(-)